MNRVYKNKLITLPLSLFISLRFSYRRHLENMVSTISLFSIIGIALGVMVLIVGLSTMNGFEYELNNRILAMVPHGEIESINQPWKNWLQALQKITHLQDCIIATPYVSFTGLIENRNNLHLITVRGVDLQQEKRLNVLSQFVQNNAWKDFKPGRKQIIIGKGVADFLKAKKGDWVSIIIHNNINCKLQQYKLFHLQIIGILQLNSHLDRNFAMIPLDDARIYLNIGNSITGIAIKVNNVFNINKLLLSAKRIIGDYVYVKSWIDTYGYMYRDIRMVRIIIYLAMTLVIGLSCFNIVSVLVMVIKNKNNDIAILRILGAKDKLIYTIFIWYGLLVGLIGSLYGAVIGIVLSLQLTVIIHLIEQLINYRFLSSSVYFIDFLPSELKYSDTIYVLMFTILLSLAASWYPALSALRICPIKILNRY